MVTLYRCRTPTDFLCPCGRVARRLRATGLEFDTVAQPHRRRDRPEVEELTGQRRVPVLVHGEEVVHDSHRILEYLEHVTQAVGAHGSSARATAPSAGSAA